MIVGIIGAGTMGSGIAQAFAACEGYTVKLTDINDEFAANGKAKIAKGLAGRVVVTVPGVPCLAECSAWLEVEAWDVGELSALEGIVGLLDAQVGILHVAVLLKASLDESLQHRVGEEVSPSQVAQAVVASRLHVAVDAVGDDVIGALVVLVELAGAQKHGSHQTSPKGGFLNVYAHFLFSYFLVI